jgi:glycosyltransferase involved in cell wall biosynthesis
LARNLPEHVILTGALAHSDIPSASAALDVLVAPYPEMEHFYFSPLKVYEYMATGKPIVASRIGQISDILEHEQSALLVPAGDVQALASAIQRLLLDQDLAARLGANAQAVARNEHGWSHRVAQWSTLFESLRVSAAPEEVGT